MRNVTLAQKYTCPK